MANRKQKRSQKNYAKTQTYPKIVISDEVKKGILLIVIILAIVCGIYFATKYLVNKGNLSTYEPSSKAESVITYEDINVGMVFNRTPNEYYVAFEYFGNKQKVEYNSVLKTYNAKEKHLPIYKVDMSVGFNNKYYSKDSNPYAQDARELKISTPTLMKIENGTNTLYIENIDKIKSELGV